MIMRLWRIEVHINFMGHRSYYGVMEKAIQ